MTLATGTRLGPYEIVGALGAGGMGEVYRARDTRLGREVALKVLPAEFAADAERMARFEREAKVLASLNHPNIASIYGFEDSSGAGAPARALVMELVEGQTLGERIAKRLPLDEALPIAKQIAEGLEYAHERGIVHRDLKPANVKITPDGVVKILDFGLAKALEGDGAIGSDPASSPTMSRLATQAGIILGTAAYMSPEQAKGKSVDRRADIWAFGCVLYEMLTGKKPFGGETITDILASVVRAEPDWAALPAGTPAAIPILLRRCLRKDAKQRLQAIGDARIAIDETLSGAELDSTATAPPMALSAASRWLRGLPWVGMAAFAIIGALFALGYIARAPQSPPAVISQILPPPGSNFALGGNVAGPPAFSPDGRKLAFAAIGSDGKQQIWVRSLDSSTAQPLAGTDGATYPFWSPDGRSLGFFANGKLNRIDASGGPVLALCDASNGRGGAWSRDGTILFTPGLATPIYRVSAAGGPPTAVTKLLSLSDRWPQFLPDGKHFLFYQHSDIPEHSGTFVASFGGGRKLLVRGESNALFAPPGYLLFIRQNTLMAQPFDMGNLRLSGNAVPLAENAVQNFIIFLGMFTVSDNGMLAFEQQGSSSGNLELLWFDRSGKQLRQTGNSGVYYAPRISPDGSRLAVSIAGAEGNSLWVFDLARNLKTRLTFSQTDTEPAWSPDGKTIVFQSGRGSVFHLYHKAADGTGKTTPLLADDGSEYSPVWLADGRYVVFERVAAAPGSHMEIWAMPASGGGKPFPVVQGQFAASEPAVSPDGKWLAYVSAESNKPEVYVQPFPHGEGKMQVSTDGGHFPLWRHDGKELFYVTPNDKLMVAEISQRGTSLAVEKVEPLFQVNSLFGPGWPYDVSADGKEFVVASQQLEQAGQPVTLVTNWPALLKKQP
jgi:serine/threonine protein kinase/Tol biopolymer transport system component